ncbi:MAG: hypothetical protein OXN85_13460 [Gemmatimonadetes bacterium]|nr:hypothetical protein [Candidatus Palauibacter australiensis]
MNENVMEFIELELKKDPGVSNATLFAGAKLIDKTIGKLNPRQFHAKYPLQVKRRLAGAGPGRAVRAPARAKAARRPRASKGAADAVLAYVTRVLKRNPGVKNAELFAGACEIDASVAELSPRQFHAKYPLQVKRRLAAAEAPKPAAPAVAEPAPAVAEPAPAAAPPAPAAEAPAMGGGDAAAVRGLLLSLVRELANAETQAETIEVMARLDGYVNDVMQAARS